MYAENILEHYNNPRNFGKLKNPDFFWIEVNPLCGDSVEIQIRLDGGERVDEVRFSGKGCAISQAAASMLTEVVKGKSTAELKRMDRQAVMDMLGVPISASRIRCALLGLVALQNSLGIR